MQKLKSDETQGLIKFNYNNSLTSIKMKTPRLGNDSI